MASVEESNTELQGILAKIREGLSSSQRGDVSDELVSFAEKLPAEAEYAELTQTAFDASEFLDRAITKAALKSLKGRTAALKRFVTAINSVTNKAKQDAAQARLETVQNILNVTKKVTSSALEARKAFEENRATDGFAAIDKVLAEVDRLDD